MPDFSRVFVCTLILLAVACKKNADVGDAPREKVKPPAKIDVTAVATNAALQHQLFGMPFSEVAAQFPSLTFEAKTNFSFNRGTSDYEQADQSVIQQDTTGNFHVFLKTSEDESDIVLHNGTVYVRQSKGHIRQKPQRDITAESWRDIAYSSVNEALHLFGPQLALTDAKIENLDARPAMRYRLTLDTQRTSEVNDSNSLLPKTVTARWRENQKILDLKGYCWVDTEAGVLTKLVLDGRIEVADREIRPTELLVHIDTKISNIGKTSPIVAPTKTIAEYVRVPKPGDLLGFFRDQLPVEPAKENKTGPPR